MKKHFFSLMLLLAALLPASGQVSRPKLIVGFVVDQMRWDYLYYYYDQYGEGGLRRLLSDGYSCDNLSLNYVPSVTAVGHSSIFTGTTPAFSGIAGNYFADNDRSVYCCADPSVRSVGSDGRDGRMSPHRLLATTIGDQLRTATNFKSKVIGVALKDRAAILPAGHSANAAYWWDTEAGHFVSSTYYMQELPAWVREFNKKYHTAPKFNIKTSNQGVDYTIKMAVAALKGEQLGQHDATDMLTVSISSTDAIGHQYSTRGKENHDVYMELDRDMKVFLDVLDAQVGRGNYLFFLTADHGAVHNYNFMRSHGIPGGGWDYDATTAALNAYLEKAFGFRPVMFEDNYQMFLNDSLIAAGGKSKQEVIDKAVEWLRRDTMFLYVVDNEKALTTTMPAVLREKIANGYCRQRSGEITVVPRAGWFGVYKPSSSYGGTSHGEWNPYDAHIPCVFMGWHVRQGHSWRSHAVTDIAPTVCAMINVQMPNSCTGTPIEEILEQ